jgi:hypothetical protein
VTSDPGPSANDDPLPTQPYGTPYGPPTYGPPTHGPVVPYPPAPYLPPLGYGPNPAYGPNPVYGPNPPYGPGHPAQGNMRAATADRERAMDVLKAAYAEGRLNQQEFDARSARVMAARTYADLAAIIADLPVGPSSVPFQVYYPPMPQPVPRTSGFAIASLVFGLIPLIGAIPAVIFGHIARAHIKATGERGDGMAVAGLVLGYLVIAGWAFVFLVAATRGG